MRSYLNAAVARLSGLASIAVVTQGLAEQPPNKPKSIRYDHSVSAVSADGKPVETANSTVFILEGHLQRTEYKVGLISIVNGATGESVFINPSNKTFAQHEKILNFDAKTGKQAESDIAKPGSSAIDFYALLLTQPGDDAEAIGEQTIDGRQARGLRSIRKGAHGTSTRTYWVDKKTNLPLLIEGEYQSTEATAPKQVSTMSRFTFDGDIDRSLFSTTPPKGYAVEEQPISASEMAVTEEGAVKAELWLRK